MNEISEAKKVVRVRSLLHKRSIPIVFLETTACIGYSIRSKVYLRKRDIEVRTTYFDKLYFFIDHCHVRNDLCKLVTTMTVKNEVKTKMPELIYELIYRKGIYDDLIYHEILKDSFKRFKRLMKKVSCLKMEATTEYYQVKKFYHEIAKVPSGADIQILAEATKIAKRNWLFFVTGDSHFTDHKDEIRNLFNVNIVAVEDLVASPQEIVHLLVTGSP